MYADFKCGTCKISADSFAEIIAYTIHYHNDTEVRYQNKVTRNGTKGCPVWHNAVKPSEEKSDDDLIIRKLNILESIRNSEKSSIN